MSRRFGIRAALLVALLLVSGVAFAQGMADSLNDVCGNIKNIVPVVALLMFIMAGGVYAIGQVLGAETRARASVWATAMLVGGVLGLIISASAGFLLTMFLTAGVGSSTITMSIGSEATCVAD